MLHRRDAEDAEFKIFLLSAERAESKKAHPPEADYTFNSFTILTMPSHIMGALKFRSNPRVRPDSSPKGLRSFSFAGLNGKGKNLSSLRPLRLCGVTQLASRQQVFTERHRRYIQCIILNVKVMPDIKG